MRLVSAAFLSAALLLTAARVVHAEAPTPEQRQEMVRVMREALVQDPSILRDALIALQKDDARRQEKVTRDVLAMMGPHLSNPADPVAGNPLGDVTVIEFYDTRCPYCRKMPPIIAELLGTDNRIKFVMKDMPILGPASQLESQALLAVQRQGGYFKLQDAIMQSTAPSTRDSLKDLANRLGLDGNAMLRDLDDPVIKARLKANIDMAAQLGIEGTPAFIIGDRMIGGAAELPELRQAVADARAPH